MTSTMHLSSEPILQNRDIVVIGLQPWYYEIGSNCRNMALQFARHNRVLYVNMPVNRKTWLAKEQTPGVREHCRRIRNKDELVEKVGDHIWQYYTPGIVESINWLPSTAAFKAINAFNNARFAQDIKKAVRQLGFKDIILFNDNDSFNGFDLKRLLQPDLSIYYSRDFLQGYAYWRKHATKLEPELIRRSDIVVANSIYLADYCRQFNPRSWYIGQGCNLELFDPSQPREIPADIAGIKRPLIGYVGAIISERLDLNIIEHIARQKPDWSIVMVGPEDDSFAQSVLHQLPNVHFTGRKNMNELAGYVAAFDVCINPQLVNDITVGNYPLKIDEYLAMGKPVVATHTRTMTLFEDVVHLANSKEDYPALIEKALQEQDDAWQQKRMTVARSHSWEHTMDILYGLIREYSPVEQKKDFSNKKVVA